VNTADDIPSEVEEILSDRLLGRSFACSCGREHRIMTRLAVVEPGIADRIPELLPPLIAGDRVLLVADKRTWEIAGARLAEAMDTAYSVEVCLLRDDNGGHLHASVDLVDEVIAAHPDDYDIFAAVGSGTVNDLTRAVAHRRDRPYFVLATAASMNGYTSSIVALLENGLKTTRPATPPVAVFADPAVLEEAPRELTLAGLGDLISKPYCGCDWRIASLVKGEYYCPVPDRLLSVPFEQALEVFPWLANGDPAAITQLFRLLLVSGLSMAITGTSSPASGGEHLLSHYWDMVRLRDSRPLNLHGAQVGVGSLVIDELYREIFELDFHNAPFVENPDMEAARREIEDSFGRLAPAVWPQWEAKLVARSDRDLDRLRDQESLIKGEIEHTLAVGRSVRHVLSAAGAPTRADQLGISGAELGVAIRRGRMIRNRFTALDVAAELGVLERFADRMIARGSG
jgi:glycerol-1-phosphate dehydrogenase [NAD(P)+]